MMSARMPFTCISIAPRIKSAVSSRFPIAAIQRCKSGHRRYIPSPSSFDRPGALQSDILVGQVAPPRSSPEEITLETVNSVPGSSFGSRINMNPREDKHWSYGAVTVLSVTDIAKSIYRPDGLEWVVVGDRARIESPIRQLGLGEIKSLDTDGNPK